MYAEYVSLPIPLFFHCTINLEVLIYIKWDFGQMKENKNV